MSEPTPTHHPASVLMNLVINLLTPMFLASVGNNLPFARQAATKTLNAYRAETRSDLITVAKIIGFGLAALATLGLSMAEPSYHYDPSSPRQRLRPLRRPQPRHPEAAEMKARTAEHLAKLANPAANIPPVTSPAVTSPAVTTPVAKPTPAVTAPDISDPSITDRERVYQATWAASAATIAAETAASLSDLPPDERRTAAIWIDVLNACAKDFMAGDVAPRMRPDDLAGMMPPPA